ncbi:MAG: sialidase family protein [Lentisphaeria bacterium]
MLKTKILTNPGDKYKTASRQFQGIPGIEVTPRGRLWATWYSGGVDEGPENFVVLVSSTDGGKSWSEPRAVMDPLGSERAFDPTLWIGPDGILRWFWAQTWSPANRTISNGVDGVWFSECADLEADSPEWSEPTRIANGVMMNKPIVLSNGDWAFPTALWTGNIGNATAPESLRGECFSNVTISSDCGRSFSLRGGADVPKRHFDEHCLVELKDGRLWVLVRTDTGIGESFSLDRGATWSKGQDSGLGGPNSRFYIRRLKSGRILLVNHAKDPKTGKYARNRLTAYLSEDDGKSWQGGLLLDERDGVSYPDGCQDQNGDIWIIYDYERYKKGDILLAKFTEQDVLAGKLVSSTSELKVLINSTGGIKK